MYFASDFDFGGTYSSRRCCKVASPGAELAILTVRHWRKISRNSSREASVARNLKIAHTLFKTLAVVDRDGVGIRVMYRKHSCELCARLPPCLHQCRASKGVRGIPMVEADTCAHALQFWIQRSLPHWLLQFQGGPADFDQHRVSLHYSPHWEVDVLAVEESFSGAELEDARTECDRQENQTSNKLVLVSRRTWGMRRSEYRQFIVGRVVFYCPWRSGT